MRWIWTKPQTIRWKLNPARESKIGAKSLPEGHVALTFDDGPHREYTAQILSILRDANWLATFFQLGIQTARFPETARKVARAGHTVGSHTFRHFHLPDEPFERAQEEIQLGIEFVARATKVKTPFLRFPYGESNDSLDLYVKQQGLISFYWDVEGRDWEIKDESMLLEHILAQVRAKKGGVILLHDIHRVTVAVLPKLITQLKRLDVTPVQFVPSTE